MMMERTPVSTVDTLHIRDGTRDITAIWGFVLSVTATGERVRIMSEFK